MICKNIKKFLLIDKKPGMKIHLKHELNGKDKNKLRHTCNFNSPNF